MNRAYFIIMIPALVVLIGYVLVFRMIGIALPYPAVIAPVVLLVAIVVWMVKRGMKKVRPSTK
jgi:ABC-type glycerol-3-phosphate transport system permease component